MKSFFFFVMALNVIHTLMNYSLPYNLMPPTFNVAHPLYSQCIRQVQHHSPNFPQKVEIGIGNYFILIL